MPCRREWWPRGPGARNELRLASACKTKFQTDDRFADTLMTEDSACIASRSKFWGVWVVVRGSVFSWNFLNTQTYTFANTTSLYNRKPLLYLKVFAINFAVIVLELSSADIKNKIYPLF